jgi:hypothetical protein
MLPDTLDFIKLYLELLNQSLVTLGTKPLSKSQKAWFGFCIMAVLFTNSICWKAWERLSFGKYSDAALSKMFRAANIPWNSLLCASIKMILQRYGIKKGVLVIDDSDHERSKNTTKIGYVHRIKDKKNDGYYQGQNLVFLLLVTDTITIPVGFTFYIPDPALRKWKAQNKQLKKEGLKKKERPAKPLCSSEHPTKLQIALDLINIFFKNNHGITIKCILADAMYGSADFVAEAAKIQKGVQVISQLRSTQLVRNKKGLLVGIKEHFKNAKTLKKSIHIRGGKEKVVIFRAEKLYVDAHKSKRVVIAIKYKEEKEFRYIIATDLTWRDIDIIQAYTLRWLIEVFFQDWKSYEGWSNLAKQQGVEGSCRGVILSLLLDHSLFFQEAQRPCIENKLPLHTIGSLIEKCRLETIVNAFASLFKQKDTQMAEQVKHLLDITIPLQISEKHMNGKGFQKVFLEAA